MSQLVVVAGPRTGAWATGTRHLATYAETLAEQGVAVVEERADLDLDLAVEVAFAKSPDTVILVGEGLADTVLIPGVLPHLIRAARRHEASTTLVLILQDQRIQLNEAYCRRVLALQTGRTFAEFATSPPSSLWLDHKRRLDAYRTALGDAGSLLAMPASTLDDEGCAAQVLAAAGIATPSIRQALATPIVPPPHATVPGPVLVAAGVLLHKVLARSGRNPVQPRAMLGRFLRQRGDEEHWDLEPFWGFSAELCTQVTARYAATNAAVAAALWQTAWPIDVSSRAHHEADLAMTNPVVVSSMIKTLRQLSTNGIPRQQPTS